MDKEIITEEDVKRIKNSIYVLESTGEHEPNKDEWFQIELFAEQLRLNSEDKLCSLCALFHSNMDWVLYLLFTVKEFALKKKIPFFSVLKGLVCCSYRQVSIFGKGKINFTDFREFHNLIAWKYNKVSEYLDSNPKLIGDFLDANPNTLSARYTDNPNGNNDSINAPLLQEVLNNSYDEIKKQVFKNTKNIDLPLDQYHIKPMKCLSEINHEKYEVFNDLFTPRVLGQMKIGNHFMRYILDDKIMVTDDNKVVFSGHTKALSIGYTQKAITVSLDKVTTIRELEAGLKYLKKQKQEDVSGLIEYNEKLIEIVRQKKHAEIIQFKALSKEVGITKNEAKRYAIALKGILGVTSKTIENNFDEIIVHDFTK